MVERQSSSEEPHGKVMGKAHWLLQRQTSSVGEEWQHQDMVCMMNRDGIWEHNTPSCRCSSVQEFGRLDSPSVVG